ncbi:MAG: hypothetical protein LBQ69_04090, partial [Treponema sp.]|nr:hypothetical protein [Treponema sp.]
LFSQDSGTRELGGSIPEELLRPRRDETPRYPIDTVIGPLGQGDAPREAYDVARRAAEALLAGTKSAAVLSTVNSVFLDSYMSALNEVNPRLYRLGGGREGPDGSVSFLVRFAGREQGITGELFVRLEERRSEERRPAAIPPVSEEAVNAENEEGDDVPEAVPAVAEEQPEPQEQEAPPVTVTVTRVWIFEDLILEEPRSREAENTQGPNRFDFSPYERFF